MLRLLNKSFAKKFYQQHAGYFLVGIYLLFGIVEPSQLIDYQKTLLLAGISSPMGLLIVFLSWLLYVLKVYFFVKHKLALAQYKFIHEIGALNIKTQLKIWLSLYAVMLLPVTIYALALIGLSIYYHFFLSFFCVLIVFFTLILGLSLRSYQLVTIAFLKEEQTQNNTGIKIILPFFSWPIVHLFKEQPLMLFMCKLSSLVLFKAMLWMFADVGNDTRVLLIALLASVLCHSVLVYTLLRFEIAFLNFSKSLPVSIYKRLYGWLVIFTMVLIPEWILLIVSSAYNLYSIANGFLFSLTSIFFLLTVMYFIRLNVDNYLKWLLFFFFTAMWAILGHYYLVFSLVLLVCCTTYYMLNFDKIDLQTGE